MMCAVRPPAILSASGSGLSPARMRRPPRFVPSRAILSLPSFNTPFEPTFLCVRPLPGPVIARFWRFDRPLGGLAVASAAPMNPLMTRYAERHQIALLMCAAVREWTYVMHECRENVSAVLFTLLAERIPRQMSVTDFLPRIPIPLVLIVATGKMLVMFLHNFLVCLTVTAFPVCKIRTACHSTRALWFSRHCVSPSKKPSRRIASPRRLIPYPILAEYIISLSR